MTQQNPLLPANIDPAPQVLPAVTQGLGPADVLKADQPLNHTRSENARATWYSA